MVYKCSFSSAGLPLTAGRGGVKTYETDVMGSIRYAACLIQNRRHPEMIGAPPHSVVLIAGILHYP